MRLIPEEMEQRAVEYTVGKKFLVDYGVRQLLEAALDGCELAPFQLSEEDEEFLLRTEQRELTSGAEQRLCDLVRRAQRTLRRLGGVTVAEANAVYEAAGRDHESSTAENTNTRVALERFLVERTLAPKQAEPVPAPELLLGECIGETDQQIWRQYACAAIASGAGTQQGNSGPIVDDAYVTAVADRRLAIEKTRFAGDAK